MRVVAIETERLCPIGNFAAPLVGDGCEIVYWRPDRGEAAPSLDGMAGVLALGGAANPDENELYTWLAEERTLLSRAIERRMPTLGVCLGAELLAEVLGGRTTRLPEPQIGWTELARAQAVPDQLSSRLPHRFPGFEWHTYAFTLPPNASLIAGSLDTVEAFSWNKHVWGFQFHPEADPQIIGEWAAHYSETLLSQGIEPAHLLTETARLATRQRRAALCITHAFAAEVARYLPPPRKQ